MNWLKRNQGNIFCAILLGALVLIAVSVTVATVRDISNIRIASQAPPAPVVKVGDVEGPIRDRVRERLLLTIIRHKAIARMQRDGFALANGDKTPLSAEKAEQLYEKLTDEMVLAAAREASPQTVGKLGDGTLLANLIQWIADHQEEILAILKLVLSILALL